jgi:hypothetical protein
MRINPLYLNLRPRKRIIKANSDTEVLKLYFHGKDHAAVDGVHKRLQAQLGIHQDPGLALQIEVVFNGRY